MNQPRSQQDTPYLLFYQLCKPEPAHPADLDLADIADILSNNLRHLQQAPAGGFHQTSSSSRSSDPDEEENKYSRSGSCSSNEFAGSSNRFIY